MLDILLLGATGYTGRLITRYLAAHPQRETFTFGITARSEKKFNTLRDELGDALLHVPTFVVDIANFDDVERAVQEARVVINAVGPFWRWGTSVVRACVRHGRHYVDFDRRNPVGSFDYAAAKAGCVVVPCAGLDSVPSDLVVYVASRTLKSFAGASTAIDSSTSAWRLGGQSISGGTFSTMLSFLEDVPRWKARKVTQDFALSPVEGVPGPRPRAFYALPIDPSMRGVLYLMSIVNKQVVQRSWGLFELASRSPDLVLPSESFAAQDVSGLSYGPTFKYDEFMVLPSRLQAIFVVLFLATVAFAMATLPPARWMARQLMPRSGEGPSDRDLDAGFLHITNITTSAPVASGRTVTVRTTFKGKGDPGYLLSSIMISEAALALVQDKDLLPPFGKRGGVLTPMTAFGDVLIQRLNACGRISIESGAVPVENERMKAR
ncbi:Saccharopine dehydrogenase-domain-containing protein [Pisolithus croceorrhizus]|nr:Saccharopine dehydrogenase-domain-containing protein [Pisolithus croceorrhizus]KAI6114665.1 Saccharopine dehydrogenase-domain-containing protein [Pisolithus croceorrhizus]KAI6159174.1 Saccharopine dehydrogenase-domain-containing protein [Pisolithus thermaeus]